MMMSDKPEALTEGELWSLFRSIMTQGVSIHQDYESGVHETYEHYSARLDAAAAERQAEFWAARIAPLHAECERLRTVMIAAAEEISAHWDAHCDADGYGPANLMHRLEQGIAAQYGYTAGAFATLKKERDEAGAECERLRAVLSEAADFWAHYSSLNEGDQDDLNQQRLETLDAMRAAIRATPTEPSLASCGCRACIRTRGDTIAGVPREMSEMILCSTCGNKRCPHATDHRHACTGSNDPGQPGSAYGNTEPKP